MRPLNRPADGPERRRPTGAPGHTFTNSQPLPPAVTAGGTDFSHWTSPTSTPGPRLTSLSSPGLAPAAALSPFEVGHASGDEWLWFIRYNIDLTKPFDDPARRLTEGDLFAGSDRPFHASEVRDA